MGSDDEDNTARASGRAEGLRGSLSKDGASTKAKQCAGFDRPFLTRVSAAIADASVVLPLLTRPVEHCLRRAKKKRALKRATRAERKAQSGGGDVEATLSALELFFFRARRRRIRAGAWQHVELSSRARRVERAARQSAI